MTTSHRAHRVRDLEDRGDAPARTTDSIKTGMFRDDRGTDEVVRVVAAAKRGDQDALHWLYLRFRRLVHSHARNFVRNDHDAEDISQQVFMRLLTALGRYEQGATPFSAWLVQITRNAAIDHLRRQDRRVADELDADRGVGQHDSHLARSLREALSALPAHQREILVLRHLGGYSPGEIAEHMGRSEGSVHGLHHRGRRALRTALEEVGVAPVTVG